MVKYHMPLSKKIALNEVFVEFKFISWIFEFKVEQF